ncbi:hypothetical protein N1F89_12200 [Aquibium sp. A9E412]|uniref:hypothetical protein n=1 Tax=Aquibium sp. A9E412 TaxID=2976767 RepID=UPI0025B24C2D|nr:hypothetical protein [Aquibium sp. A9E412]MDN2566982.1 hypothetical protein [Aquibium sp. A9E412]
MNDAGPRHAAVADGRSLAAAIRQVKNDQADRDDVVVEMREAQRMRLELLAEELKPVFDEVPDDAALFDFAISTGIQPRLWIDAVSHVAMGRDRRTYRFVRDTRLGRVVLAESPEMAPVADQVTRYVAERLVERQRLMEGDVERPGGQAEERAPPPVRRAEARPGARSWATVLSTALLVIAGGAVGVAAMLLFLARFAPELGLPF